jgi:transposase
MEKELRNDNYKLSPKGQEELRKKIVRQMKKHGNSKEVAEICECTVRHVNKTWKKYQEGGIEAILAVKMGYAHGKRRKLTAEQELAVKGEITEKKPSEAGLSGYLWGRAEVSELVKRRFGIEMPLTTMGDYLARWNFTYQRPKKRITVKTKPP